MFRPRLRLTLPLLCLGAAVLLGAGLAGCESKPTAPTFDNPFDPAGPSGGNPLNLRATLLDSMITVAWDQPQGMGLDHYEVSHSLTSGSGFQFIDSVDHTDKDSNKYNYMHPTPTATHYFRVQAFSEAGEFAVVADQTPAVAATPPLIEAAGAPFPKTVSSRYALLQVTVTMQDSIQIADNAAFADPLTVAVVEPGAAQTIPWDFGPAADGDTLSLYARAFNGTLRSAEAHLQPRVGFAPAFGVAGNPAAVPARHVALDIPTVGVDSMRFALSAEALAQVPMIQGGQDYTVVLKDSAVPQTVYGEFLADFGFTAVTELTITPDLLQDVSFRLDLPADDVSGSPIVRGLCSANALWMRFSTSPDFQGVAWVDYADTTEIDLGDQQGELTVYAQYRNDWTDSAILTDTVVHVEKPLSVRFSSPANGSVLLGGVPLQVTGTSGAATGAGQVDRVMVDLGDGEGFVPVEGDLDRWSLMWDVPRYEADTPMTLRARAWSDADSTTSVIGVTVSQVTVAISEPADGAAVTAGEGVTISGQASPFLGGAAIEGVELLVGPESVAVTGTDAWSATWTAPEVAEPTDYVIAVRAWSADGEATDQISVTVNPPPQP